MADYHDLICVTERKLSRRDFISQVDYICSLEPKAVILREKDLPLEAYLELASRVAPVCRQHGVPLILHTYPEAAAALAVPRVHLPLAQLRQAAAAANGGTLPACVGTSCHSAEDAAEAERLGASYVTFGNVFETSCKPGLPARGLAQLREVCGTVRIPVYAIGGITPDNLAEVMEAGAAGGCMRSGFMEL